VQVRLGGVPGVADVGDVLSGLDPVALPDEERASAEMGVGGVHAVAVVHDEVVAQDEAGAAELASRTLDDQHEGERGPRLARPVVALSPR
jgi:hypothetical protein